MCAAWPTHHCAMSCVQVVIDRGASPSSVLLELFADGHYVTNIEVRQPWLHETGWHRVPQSGCVYVCVHIPLALKRVAA